MKKLIFIFLAIMSLSCSSCKDAASDVDSSSHVNDVQPPPASDMHGGSPTPVTWEECGPGIGDHPCDFSLVDQDGNTFQLYDNYGKVILLDFSAMWCGVCNIIAPDSQSFTELYGDQGFIWATILIDNSQGQPPTDSDIDNWCNQYGIEDSPVLAGDRSLIDMSGQSGWPISSWPTLIIIDRNMIVIHGIYGWNEELITSWIEGAL
tara:strand:- start:761 stop:1378 length:618 start_codon:yes stop_codon:yes gene_type:complete